MQKATSGFTLLELLVVITIVGILAVIVLVSTNDARNNATNSSVAQTVVNMRAQAEIFYTDHGNAYTDMCDPGEEIDHLVDGVIDANNAITARDVDITHAQDTITFMCHIAGDGSAYVVSAPLVKIGSNQEYFCADSTGWAGVTSNALPAYSAGPPEVGLTCP